jgi:hypothetical protein
VDVRGRLTYPHVASTLALVLALGGGVVYAADKIGSSEIARDAIKSKHLKDGQVKGPDVDESSLDRVPSAQEAVSAQTAASAQSAQTAVSAQTAESAESVGGVTETVVRASVPAGAATADVADIDGLRIGLGCINGGGDEGQFRARGSATGDRVTMTGTFDSPATSGDNVFAAALSNTSANSFGTGGPPTFISGTVTLRRPGGRVVVFDYVMQDQTDGFGTTDDCFLHGFARSAP